MYETWYKMNVMLESGVDIRPVITHRFHCQDFEKAFDVMKTGEWGPRHSWTGGARAVYSGCADESSEEELAGLRARPAPTRASACITSPQGSQIRVSGGGRPVLNLCANNYLGLAQHPDVIAAAHDGARRLGLRPGVGALHLRHAGDPQASGDGAQRIPRHGGHDPLRSCFDANGGLFETLLGEEDAIITDELNHASIIDGVRLCKAKRFRYKNNDMADLEAKLQEAEAARGSG